MFQTLMDSNFPFDLTASKTHSTKFEFLDLLF